MSKRYFVNPCGLLFHPEVDRRNNYKTIAYNLKENRILKVNRFGYEILKILEENPGFTVENICVLLSSKNLHKVDDFLEKMTEENIVFAE